MVWIDNQRNIEVVDNIVLQMLLESGVPLNYTDRDGANLLWYAAMRPVDIMGWKMMLDAGVECKFTPQGRNGPESTIYEVVLDSDQKNKVNVMKLLAERGCHFNNIKYEESKKNEL